MPEAVSLGLLPPAEGWEEGERQTESGPVYEDSSALRTYLYTAKRKLAFTCKILASTDFASWGKVKCSCALALQDPRAGVLDNGPGRV